MYMNQNEGTYFFSKNIYSAHLIWNNSYCHDFVGYSHDIYKRLQRNWLGAGWHYTIITFSQKCIVRWIFFCTYRYYVYLCSLKKMEHYNIKIR